MLTDAVNRRRVVRQVIGSFARDFWEVASESYNARFRREASTAAGDFRKYRHAGFLPRGLP